MKIQCTKYSTDMAETLEFIENEGVDTSKTMRVRCFRELCEIALDTVPEFALNEEMRTTIFSAGARILDLNTEDIKQIYMDVFGHLWY